MNKTEFTTHRVNARENLIDFIQKHSEKDVLEEVGKNPKVWLEEFNIIMSGMGRLPVGGMTGLWTPPLEDPDIKKISPNIYYYTGNDSRLNGLWIKSQKELPEGIDERYRWSQYKLETRARLIINDEFSSIPHEIFLPENFEKIAKRVKKEKGGEKRPILKFPIQLNGQEIEVYAKGADTTLSYFNEGMGPWYRQTNIAGISRTSSKKEMQTTLDLRHHGIKVPRVIGYYDSLSEEFLFIEGIPGTHPDKVLDKYRKQIIRQDAGMLARICKAGYRKSGFTDFDDKIFTPNQELYLIDVDDCRDIYFMTNPPFKEILLDPTDKNSVRKFRRVQKSIFKGQLKDALCAYQNSLTTTDSDKVTYVTSFNEALGWKAPTDKDMAKLTTFEKNYTTTDSFMSMMSDID